MTKAGNLRVWNVVNPLNKADYYSVLSPLEGYNLIKKLAELQLKIDSIISNAFGLEIFEDGEWCEWYNEEGKDIDEAFEEID